MKSTCLQLEINELGSTNKNRNIVSVDDFNLIKLKFIFSFVNRRPTDYDSVALASGGKLSNIVAVFTTLQKRCTFQNRVNYFLFLVP